MTKIRLDCSDIQAELIYKNTILEMEYSGIPLNYYSQMEPGPRAHFLEKRRVILRISLLFD